MTACSDGPVSPKVTKKRLDRSTNDKGESDSRKEQVIWRLERLLGDTCKESNIAEELAPPSDSICTEDFVSRFREEMVELALPDSMQQLGNKEKAERTETSDGENEPGVAKRGSAAAGGSNTGTAMAHCSQSVYPGLGKQQRKCLPDGWGVKISHGSEEAEAGERVKTPQRPTGDRSGVPVRSFDTVSIDSDLDTVCTERVRQHIHKWTGWRSFIQSVTHLNEHSNSQSDSDTPTWEESEHSASVRSPSYGHSQNRDLPDCKTPRKRRETCRLVCRPMDDKDTDGEMNRWSGTSRTVGTSEKMQSDLTKMKERLFNLRRKCEREEETLRLRRTQLKDVKLCLSELRQKKKHAMQQADRLAAETAHMEKERSALETFLRDSRAERESVSCQLQKLQRQRESCHLEVEDIKEDLAILCRHKRDLKDGSCVNRGGVIVSVLEREEMERQWDRAKTELFTEQRRARENIDSLQEKLEETRDELHRSTEAESSLRNSCACLEQIQMQKDERIEALELQVSKLQRELGECKIRVETLDEMLAQKELQVLDLQEHCGALQKERDGLKRELQHLKTQHCKELKEAQGQAHTLMIDKQAEEEKVSALKDEILSLTQHIESMQSSIQLKEEEIIKLRKLLQREKAEAQKREEELRAEASEKVNEAAEEERRKCEAEKVEAVQMHCGILEEQSRKSLESLTSAKNKSLALRQVVELKTRVLELESLLAVVCKSLKEEHQAELQCSQSLRTVLRLERDVRSAVGGSDRLRVKREERESSHKLCPAEMEQQLRHWAQQLGAECQQLHFLVEQRHGELPQSLTVAEALAHLGTLREQLKHFISQLQQELDSQKETNVQLRIDKV
ncbi:uncharacterized protein LOC142382749 [Odontesthes bonariensis]|uniref:uncharacterized protein LOC142382749 n=1 Tax=Odontesthes bonariensis TaxID=219752 RepID=UPI003F581D3E